MDKEVIKMYRADAERIDRDNISKEAARIINSLLDEIERLNKENEGFREEYLEVKRLLDAALDNPCGEYWRDYHVMPLTRRLREAQEEAEQARKEALDDAADLVEHLAESYDPPSYEVAEQIRWLKDKDN